MTPFNRFFYKVLSESPKFTGDFESPYSDSEDARRMYDDILHNDPNSYQKVFTLFDKNQVYLYEHREDNDIEIYFIPSNDNFIYGYTTGEILSDSGIMMTSVYNNKMYFGLAYKVYDEYLLTHYPYILSSSHHSKDGQSFWRKLVSRHLNTNKIEIWDIINNMMIQPINSVEDLIEFYGHTDTFERYRIKIYR